MNVFNTVKKAKYSAYAVLILAIYYLATRSCGQSPALLIQPVAMISVLGTQLLFLCFSGGGFEFLKIIGRVFRGNPTELDARRIRHTINVGFLGAGVGFLLGVVVILTNLSDWVLLGQGAAIALTSLLWAFLAAILLQSVNME